MIIAGNKTSRPDTITSGPGANGRVESVRRLALRCYREEDNDEK